MIKLKRSGEAPEAKRPDERAARWFEWVGSRLHGVARDIGATESSAAPPLSDSVRFDPSGDAVEGVFQASLGAGYRVVALIGVAPGSGASTLSRALAERNAMTGRSTLLIDASGLSPEAFAAATGALAPADSEKFVFRRLEGGGSQSILFREPAYLRRFWAEAHSDWDGIVIDCAPALSAGEDVVPGRLAAQSADATILVALGGSTTREALASALKALGSSKIVGLAVSRRGQPSVGAEAAASASRLFRRFPWLARKISKAAAGSSLLDVPA